MTNLELIDGLCTVTTLLADIVHRQREIILQAEAAQPDIEEKTEKALAELDRLEYSMRRLDR